MGVLRHHGISMHQGRVGHVARASRYGAGRGAALAVVERWSLGACRGTVLLRARGQIDVWIWSPGPGAVEVERARLQEVCNRTRWTSCGPHLRGLCPVDDRRFPPGLDGNLLARIGNAAGRVSEHLALDRWPDAHSCLGGALAREAGRWHRSRADPPCSLG